MKSEYKHVLVESEKNKKGGHTVVGEIVEERLILRDNQQINVDSVSELTKKYKVAKVLNRNIIETYIFRPTIVLDDVKLTSVMKNVYSVCNECIDTDKADWIISDQLSNTMYLIKKAKRLGTTLMISQDSLYSSIIDNKDYKVLDVGNGIKLANIFTIGLNNESNDLKEKTIERYVVRPVSEASGYEIKFKVNQHGELKPFELTLSERDLPEFEGLAIIENNDGNLTLSKTAKPIIVKEDRFGEQIKQIREDGNVTDIIFAEKGFKTLINQWKRSGNYSAVLFDNEDLKIEADNSFNISQYQVLRLEEIKTQKIETLIDNRKVVLKILNNVDIEGKKEKISQKPKSDMNQYILAHKVLFTNNDTLRADAILNEDGNNQNAAYEIDGSDIINPLDIGGEAVFLKKEENMYRVESALRPIVAVEDTGWNLKNLLENYQVMEDKIFSFSNADWLLYQENDLGEFDGYYLSNLKVESKFKNGVFIIVLKKGKELEKISFNKKDFTRASVNVGHHVEDVDFLNAINIENYIRNNPATIVDDEEIKETEVDEKPKLDIFDEENNVPKETEVMLEETTNVSDTKIITENIDEESVMNDDLVESSEQELEEKEDSNETLEIELDTKDDIALMPASIDNSENTLSTGIPFYEGKQLKVNVKDINTRKGINYQLLYALPFVDVDKAETLIETILSSYFAKKSLFLIGPMANEIVTGFSAVMYGRTPAIIDCGMPYNNELLVKVQQSDSQIILVKNIIGSDWFNVVSELSMLENKHVFFTHSFKEDMLLVPHSLYNYVTPFLIDDFIEEISQLDIERITAIKDINVIKESKATKVNDNIFEESKIEFSKVEKNNIKLILEQNEYKEIKDNIWKVILDSFKYVTEQD